MYRCNYTTSTKYMSITNKITYSYKYKNNYTIIRI